ncbi:prolyl oligopeptidase family serine peptidase [uncultured Chitinophaga sp.]|uniref:S9 family peptidase n=1 Tax=uncultured Chitinophaga sp. TaxID=339340 RepID=UPI0025DE89FF|nr:prolyl oligopeptidase family serine peptidase [uncultured Chitinophaga sp.]
MRKLMLILAAGIITLPAMAQKKVLDTADYKQWRRTSNPAMSYDGAWVVYGITDGETSETHIRNIATGKDVVMDNVSDITFFNSGKWMRYKKQDSLLLTRLKDGKQVQWNKSSFVLTTETSPLLTYSDRTHAVIWNVDTNDSTVLPGVSRVTLFGNQVIYQKGKELFAGPLKGLQAVVSRGEVTDYSFNKEQQEGTYTNGTELYYFSLKGGQPQLLMDFNDIKVPAGYQLRPRAYEITPATKQLVLDLSYQSKPQPPAKTDPRAVDLELWTWNEAVSQRRQRRGVYSRTMMDDAKFVYHLDTRQLVEVAPEFSGILLAPSAPAFHYAVYIDEKPYRLATDWTYDTHLDVYQVNVRTGERKLIAKDVTDKPQWSPNGRFALMYSDKERAWLLLDPQSGTFSNISAAIGYPVHDELADMERMQSAYGIAGWLNEGNTVVLYDRYDLWAVDLTGATKPRSLTNGFGREHKVALRFQGTPYRAQIDPTASLLLSGFNEHTKSDGVYRFTPFKKVETLVDEAGYSVKVAASTNNAFLFSRQSFSQFPDLWWANGQMKAAKRLTNINPQQQQYNWGTAKVIEWKNFNGVANQGLLYLPENYNASQQYPVIVDFYETHSNDLHNYLAPGYSSSTIDIATFVSKGYIVFRPDVHFGVGKPGEDAYNAVVSGTQELIARGIADKEHIGLQGHSFAGFEVAYIATRTSMFRCINVGAGIVNIVYNYTALRANGAPGMFKTEVDQYRIGKTLWEDREAYLANSPILNADKISSPLLIFHNDKDGAVPFSQGLDLFLAMRRLQKPAWLLNYKGQNHTVEDLACQQDWTARMAQYFDHYLMGKPMPRWMKEGISADERKVDRKFDY